MAEDGLNVRWTSLRASDIGAPHHRERLFILATPPDTEGIGPGERIQSLVAGVPAATRRSGAGAPEPGGAVPDDTDSIRRQEGTEQPVAGSAEVAPVVGDLGALPGDGRTDDVLAVLPTPRTTDSHGPGQHGTGGQDLRTTIAEAKFHGHPAWGKYAPAIHRWEQITRPAPAPTELNRNNKPRLNAAFAEWMMGLPPGHVTDPAIGISRAEQLKAVGNGVCPQQAYAAGRELLAMTTDTGGSHGSDR